MYTDVKLMEVLASVEKEFNTTLAKAEENSKLATLAKAEDKPFPPKDDKKPEEKEDKKPEDKKEEPKAKEGEGDKKPEEKPAEAKPEDKMAPPEGDHGYDDEDMDHMHKMYMSMSKAELKAHHDSVRKALDSQGMEKCGDMAMSMDKSEKDTKVETTIEVKIPDLSKEHALLKSERDLIKTELDAEKSKAAELQKKVDLATEFMAKLAAKKSAPQGKSITTLDVIAKGEDSKEAKTYNLGEVTSILAKKSADPTLSKSDRDAINEFYLGSKKHNIEVVKHLLA